MRTRFANAAQHADAFLVIRAISIADIFILVVVMLLRVVFVVRRILSFTNFFQNE